MAETPKSLATLGIPDKNHPNSAKGTKLANNLGMIQTIYFPERKSLTGESFVGKSAIGQRYMPRIIPTPCHIRALRGPWSLEGEEVRLYEEPGTGVLLALNRNGERVNPLKVISHGKKMENREPEGGVSQH